MARTYTPVGSIGVTRAGGYTLLRFLTSFPIACFTCALLTDLAYWRTANMQWANFSAWLLAVGLAMATLAALVGLITLFVSREARDHGPIAPVLVGSVSVLGVALVDNLVHSRDQWTSVVPLGLVLTACTVVLTLLTLWLAVPVDVGAGR